MSRNRSNLQFLSQPVILEETGIPGISVMIIVAVFLMITAFITWSVMMEMDEITRVEGRIVSSEAEGVAGSEITEGTDGTDGIGRTENTTGSNGLTGSDVSGEYELSGMVCELMVFPDDVVVIEEEQSVKIIIPGLVGQDNITGAISHIPEVPLLTAGGLPYYSVLVNIQSGNEAIDSISNLLMPGMAVEAEIITGQRTLFQYLIQPIIAGKDSAFREK